MNIPFVKLPKKIKTWEQIEPKSKVSCKALVSVTIISLIIWGVIFAVISKAEGGTMDLTKAVIHHSASHDVSVKEIDRWHRERGFDEIGYNFLIRENGDVEKGRAITKQGAHALTGKPYSRNHYVGICLTGYDKFTAQQVAALVRLLQELKIKHIETHHEKCPSSGLDMDYIRRMIK